MNLYKKTYVRNWDHLPPEERHRVTVERNGKLVDRNAIDPDKVVYVVQDAGQWRKANAIHRWFVQNVQEGMDNCGSYYVSTDQLRELLQLVETVLAHPDMAPQLLPTQEGFFFGSTEYDDWYMDDLKLTKDILEQALSDEYADFEYSSSW